MPGPKTAKTTQTPLDGFFKRFFRALIGNERSQAAVSLILGPYLIACLITWWGRGSFWGPEFSFFEDLLVCVLFVLGGRLWDLQRKAEKADEQTRGISEKLGELQRALDLKGALGDRLLQIKGVSLDITVQLSDVERKIDAIQRQS